MTTQKFGKEMSVAILKYGRHTFCVDVKFNCIS